MTTRVQLFTVLSTVLVTLGIVAIVYGVYYSKQQSQALEEAAVSTDQYLNNCVTTMLETGMLKIEQLPTPTPEVVATESAEASPSALPVVKATATPSTSSADKR